MVRGYGSWLWFVVMVRGYGLWLWFVVMVCVVTNHIMVIELKVVVKATTFFIMFYTRIKI